MAGIKRNPKTMDILSREDLIYLIETIGDARTRAMISLMYLTAARVSEVIGSIKKKHIKFEGEGDHKLMVVHAVRTLKKRGALKEMRRTIPVPYIKEIEFIIHVENYLKYVDEDDYFLFDISRQRAWKLIMNATNLFPYIFRHIRLTHLTIDYNFSAQELQAFTGWSNIAPASFYIHLNHRDLAKKMLV